MKFKNKDIVNVSVEQMNDILNTIKKAGRIVRYRPYREDLQDYFTGFAYINENKVSITVSTMYNGRKGTYQCRLDGKEFVDTPRGLACYRILSQYYKVPQLKCKLEISAKQLLGYNPKYNGQRIKAIGYDLNSAYSNMMLQGWINTEVPIVAEMRPIKQGEIGFDNELTSILKPGQYSQFIFPKIDSPDGIKRFVHKYFDEKQKSTQKLKELDEKLLSLPNGEERNKCLELVKEQLARKSKAKSVLNYSVGCLQTRNPFLRAYVVCSCNEYIKERLDENSVLWNTDSIVSITKREDLEENLGNGIGQWKIEHDGVVAIKGVNYQWDDEKPSYRGIPKQWFDKDFDILTDKTPKQNNIHYFDKEAFQIRSR